MNLTSIINSFGHGISSAARALARPALIAATALMSGQYTSQANSTSNNTFLDKPPIQQVHNPISVSPSSLTPYPTDCPEECGKIVNQHCIHEEDCPEMYGRIDMPFGIDHETYTANYYVTNQSDQGIYWVHPLGHFADIVRLDGHTDGTPWGLALTPEYIWVVVHEGGGGFWARAFEREGGPFWDSFSLNDALLPTGLTYDAFRKDFLVWDAVGKEVFQYDAVYPYPLLGRSGDLGATYETVLDIALRPIDKHLFFMSTDGTNKVVHGKPLYTNGILTGVQYLGECHLTTNGEMHAPEWAQGIAFRKYGGLNNYAFVVVDGSFGSRDINIAEDGKCPLKKAYPIVHFETAVSEMYGVERPVHFTATDLQGIVLAEWDATVDFITDPELGYIAKGTCELDEVPEDATHMSADMPHTLRRRVPINRQPDGSCLPQFTGTKKLLGGDLDGNNWTCMDDFPPLQIYFGSNEPSADINGDGTVNGPDFTIFGNNMGQYGDQE